MSLSPTRVAPTALLAIVALTCAATPSVAAKKGADKQAPTLSALTVAPVKVVLGTKSGGRTSFTVSLKAADASGVDRVVVGLYDEGDKKGRSFRLARTSGSALEGVWRATVSLPNSVDRGGWKVRAHATDKVSNTSEPDTVYGTFGVQYPTRLRKLNVSPEPVAPKADLSAVVELQRFRPGKGWTPYGGRNVVLEFRPEGAATFAPVMNARTDGAGTVSFPKLKADRTGVWRVTFAGNSGFAAAVSRTDTVKVAASAASVNSFAAPTDAPTDAPTPVPAPAASTTPPPTTGGDE